tara:strand:+ start:41 stop:409 length:369 start_codon:yes stop_codon:yes gene_type:complete
LFIKKSIILLISLLFSNNLFAENYNTAVIRGLDKVTATVITFEASIGQTIKFGTLEIMVRACIKSSPEEPPESSVFIDVWETRPSQSTISVYRGWMIASSPSLAAMEHPVYDLWIIDCKSQS